MSPITSHLTYVLRYDVEIDAHALVDLRVVHLLSEYSRIHNNLLGYIEELESGEADYVEPEIEETDIHIEGPELHLVHVDLEESVRRRMIDVIVRMCSVDDETDFEDLTLLSFPTEVVRSQAISYDLIKQETKTNLRGRKVSVDTFEEVLKEIENRFETKGIRINYY